MIAVLPAAHQKVTARHLQRQAMLYVRASVPCIKFSKIPKVRLANMPYASGLLLWAGPASALSSSIKTWANLARRPLIVLAFNAWSPRSVSAIWAWLWA